jgi:hypothetical protein
MRPSFSEQLASPDVQDGCGKKQRRRENKYDVQHMSSSSAERFIRPERVLRKSRRFSHSALLLGR